MTNIFCPLFIWNSTLKVLTIMSRDRAEFTSIMGALQIAKVYKSGHNEMFGVMWPSIKGKPHFLGKEYRLFEKPEVRYFDPDTLVIHESALPEYLEIISDAIFGEYVAFVEFCYPSGQLKSNLSKGERKLLLEVLKNSFYQNAVDASKYDALNAQQFEIEFAVEEIQEEREAKILEVYGADNESSKATTNASDIDVNNQETDKSKKLNIENPQISANGKVKNRGSKKFKRKKWRR